MYALLRGIFYPPYPILHRGDTKVGYVYVVQDGRIAQEWNRTRKPGRLSRKAEYEHE